MAHRIGVDVISHVQHVVPLAPQRLLHHARAAAAEEAAAARRQRRAHQAVGRHHLVERLVEVEEVGLARLNDDLAGR